MAFDLKKILKEGLKDRKGRSPNYTREHWPNIGWQGFVESRAVAESIGIAATRRTKAGSCRDPARVPHGIADAGVAGGTVASLDRESGGDYDR